MTQSKISISTAPLPEIPLKLSIAWVEKVVRDDVNKCWVISGTSKNGPRSLHIYDDGKVWNPGAKEKYDPELLPPESFIKDVYIHRKLIAEHFSVVLPDSKETIGIPKPIGAPSVYSIDWKKGPFPPEVTESNIWKLYQVIDQSEGLNVERKQMALNGLKTQLFVKLHADWIAKMGILHRTGDKATFKSEKNTHIDKLAKQGDLNVDVDYERSRPDDTLRGPPLDPYALAIHPKESYIDTKKPIPNIESVKAEIRAEVKGFEDLADRILKVKEPNDKARVIKVLVHGF